MLNIQQADVVAIAASIRACMAHCHSSKRRSPNTKTAVLRGVTYVDGNLSSIELHVSPKLGNDLATISENLLKSNTVSFNASSEPYYHSAGKIKVMSLKTTKSSSRISQLTSMVLRIRTTTTSPAKEQFKEFHQDFIAYIVPSFAIENQVGSIMFVTAEDSEAFLWRLPLQPIQKFKWLTSCSDIVWKESTSAKVFSHLHKIQNDFFLQFKSRKSEESKGKDVQRTLAHPYLEKRQYIPLPRSEF